jgi:SET domain-containing protein|tara:strand:+ start:333 stop:617 length:285 start_codon:yes stop_codon:yes gene_type:complete
MNYNPLPICCTIRPSWIEGLGVFAVKEIRQDTELGVSHIEFENELYRTPLGGFINHSDKPNCVRIKNGNKWLLKTIKDIFPNQELTLNYVLYKP